MTQMTLFDRPPSTSDKTYREIHRDAKMHCIEYKPTVRMFKFSFQHVNSIRSLAVPYMQFTRYAGHYGTSLHISFTNEPLESIEHDVYFPPLPNVWWPSLQVCLQHCEDAKLETMMRYFWNTRYLDCEDWYCMPVLDRDLPMRTYERWEKMSLENPNFILGVKWTDPCKISDIPKFDEGGTLVNGHNHKEHSGGYTCRWPGSITNRKFGSIRNFAVVRSSRNLY